MCALYRSGIGSRRDAPVHGLDSEARAAAGSCGRRKDVMHRRAFLGALGLLTTPLAAEAQPAVKVYRIGLLGGSPPKTPGGRRAWEGFCQGMRELRYVEGRSILVEGRFYGDQTARLPALAAELVRLNVDVIVAGAPPAPEADQRATSTIPIVMAIHSDPVGSGLAASLAKPEERHGTINPHSRAGRQAAAAAQGGDSRNLPRGRALESDRCNPGARVERSRGRGASIEGAAPASGSAGSQRLRRAFSR